MDPSNNSEHLSSQNYYTSMAPMLWASTQTMLANDIDLSLLHRIKYNSDDMD